MLPVRLLICIGAAAYPSVPIPMVYTFIPTDFCNLFRSIRIDQSALVFSICKQISLFLFLFCCLSTSPHLLQSITDGRTICKVSASAHLISALSNVVLSMVMGDRSKTFTGKYYQAYTVGGRLSTKSAATCFVASSLLGVKSCASILPLTSMQRIYRFLLRLPSPVIAGLRPRQCHD